LKEGTEVASTPKIYDRSLPLCDIKRKILYFDRCLNIVSDGAEVTCDGRLFQN